VESCIIGVTAFSGLPALSPFVGSLGQVRIGCSSFALAPDHSGSMARDGAVFRVRLRFPFEGAGIGAVLVFVPSVNQSC
jgi:hypothetical protein